MIRATPAELNFGRNKVAQPHVRPPLAPPPQEWAANHKSAASCEEQPRRQPPRSLFDRAPSRRGYVSSAVQLSDFLESTFFPELGFCVHENDLRISMPDAPKMIAQTYLLEVKDGHPNVFTRGINAAMSEAERNKKMCEVEHNRMKNM